MWAFQKKKATKITKKKGIDLNAQISNTEDLRSDLAKRFPHLISPPTEQEDSAEEDCLDIIPKCLIPNNSGKGSVFLIL